LGQLANIRKVMGPATINSENGLLRAYVLLNVRGRDMIGFVEEAAKVVSEKLKLPPGYYTNWSGQFENQVRAKNKLFILVPLALFINFTILYLGFKSFTHTLIIFMAIPVSLTGGVLLLWMMGFNFSVAVWVGFIALFGIAVDDGVLMTTYLNKVFREKKPKSKPEIWDATVQAARIRVRPMVMTSVTTILALMPVMFATGTGSEIMKPMAVPTVGGMVVLFLSLIVVPLLYAWVEERKLSAQAKPENLQVYDSI